jgi:hypothetical protein
MAECKYHKNKYQVINVGIQQNTTLAHFHLLGCRYQLQASMPKFCFRHILIKIPINISIMMLEVCVGHLSQHE